MPSEEGEAIFLIDETTQVYGVIAFGLEGVWDALGMVIQQGDGTWRYTVRFKYHRAGEMRIYYKDGNDVAALWQHALRRAHEAKLAEVAAGNEMGDVRYILIEGRAIDHIVGALEWVGGISDAADPVLVSHEVAEA